MTSKLGTRLIGLEHIPGEASDTLWRFADLSDVEISRTPISDKLAVELATFLEGEPAKKFASLLPSLHSLRTVLAAKPVTSIRTGAAKNPHADDKLLEELVATGGSAAKIATERLERRKALDIALTCNATSDIALAYESLSLDTDVAGIASRMPDHISSILPLFGSDRRYQFRGLVLSDLESNVCDQISAMLVGVIDQEYAADLIDESLAVWLTESDSTRAAASREQINADHNTAKQFASRLTDSAMYCALDCEMIKAAINAAISRRFASHQKAMANTLDRSMLSTLRLTGMTSDEISALVFSSNVSLSTEELVKELEGVEPLRLSMFLGGQTLRNPVKGETEAILQSLDLHDQEKIALALGSDIKDLPWYPELLLGIPRSFVPVDDHRSSRIMNTFLNEVLGSNVKAWEVVLSMSGEWEGSLRSLTNAAQQL